MTATATEVSPEALSLADALLARADLWLYRDVTADHARYALARALDRDGPDSPHAAFLAEALCRRSKTERRRGPRSDAARIARRLLESGATPTAAAVADKLTQKAAAAARAARIAPLIERDGAPVARLVADYRRRHGIGPGWGRLAYEMRQQWRASDAEHVIRALVNAGWLTCTRDPGSLRPGSRARGLT
jgi:hypothetical protein